MSDKPDDDETVVIPAGQNQPDPDKTIVRPADQTAPNTGPASLSAVLAFQRYYLKRKLGEGGMGVVWLAEDTNLKRREIALKFLATELSGDEKAVENLQRETTRCLDLTNEHIVRVHSLEHDGKNVAISMEYIDGRHLGKWMKETGKPCRDADEVAPIARQICEALAYAHRKDVVHRDLKPANIMLTEGNNTVKVMDFGISRTAHGATMTTAQLGAGVGTLPYMSPQQLMGEIPEPSDDIYALGATLYELLTGAYPINPTNRNINAFIAMIPTHVPSRMADRRVELYGEKAASLKPIPENWETTIAACLAKDPAQRPKTADEVWSMLSGEITRNTPPPPKPKRPFPIVKLAIALVILAAIAAAIILSLSPSVDSMRPQPQQPPPAPAPATTAQPEQPQHPRVTQPETQPKKAPPSGSAISTPKQQQLPKQQPRDSTPKSVTTPTPAPAPKPVREEPKRTVPVPTGQPGKTLPSSSASASSQARVSTPTPAPVPPKTIAAPVAGQNWKVPSLDMPLVAIKAGAFSMGNATGDDSDEQPVTAVKITKPFWIGKHEVTQKEWTVLMRNNPSRFKGENLPVENVRWEEAMDFCQRLNERERAAGRLPADYEYNLPSEAQWEYACRAGQPARTSATLSGWHRSNSASKTHPVGERPANAWGLHDMYGNVWEWTRTWHGAYPGGIVRDYEGPDAGLFRVYRGSSWTDSSSQRLWPTFRGKFSPTDRAPTLGFRIVLAPVVN